MKLQARWRVASLLLVAAIVSCGGLGVPRPASADCIAPTLVPFHRLVMQGDVLRVDGSWFGADCFDTGPPPAGEGVLGKPLVGIEIVLVRGDLEWPLASGNADADYAFSVGVRIPIDVPVGVASLVARLGPARVLSSVEIEILPPTEPFETVLEFAPEQFGPPSGLSAAETVGSSTASSAMLSTTLSTTPSAAADGGVSSSGSRQVWPWLLGVVAVLGVTFVSLARRRRRSDVAR